MEKTNVMRLLDAAKVVYIEKIYDPEIVNGETVAQAVGEDPDSVFKTLVTEDEKRNHYVFVVPVNRELDLKKAAKAAGTKSIVMIHQKELLPLTGYVHGGCSPIGMRKPFPTFIDETAQLFDVIFVSGGRRGFQIGINPNQLAEYCHAVFRDFCK
ncbi:MAG: Cys-tRNA(Pro) deacylase [Bacilli bacterium]|nr:Cys-tRNA(Pro) deacylase [Bacilli bacterium]